VTGDRAIRDGGPVPRGPVFVFDDDPTGTQTVSDVDVILDASPTMIDRVFDGSRGAVYVLTNTRAMPEREAVAWVRELKKRVDAAAQRHGTAWTLVLRGDSTLRGHVFAELDAVASRDAAILFVPAFLEGGRTTIDGEQRVLIDGTIRNVADTEFAHDMTFAFTSRDLVSWVAEVGGGRRARMVPLDVIRASDGAAVAAALIESGPGEVVIPEISDPDDIQAALRGLLAAEASGRQVAVRAASTFAAARAGLRSRLIDRSDLGPDARILLACGSHTQASGAQLAVLAENGHPTHIVRPGDATRAIDDVRAELDRGRVAVVATPRAFVDGTDLASGNVFLDAIVDVAGAVASDVDAVISKGGITSARLATALGAQVARVEGQMAPGVALWMLDLPSRRLPFVVVPGNVGDRSTLLRLLEQMGVRSDASRATGEPDR